MSHVKQPDTTTPAGPVTAEASPPPSALVFLPVPATGEDCFCSCVICHAPRREEDSVERGKPVEWIVRMRLRDRTIWRGLHTECWERNLKPLPAAPFGPPAFVTADATFVETRESGSAPTRKKSERAP
jgi:hypothetical protein